MKTAFKTCLCTVLILMLLPACAELGDIARDLPLSEDQIRVIQEATLLFSGIGGITGAIIGHQVDHESGKFVGLVIGAGVGAVIGQKYGEHVAKKKAEYATEEEFLDRSIADAETVNRQTREYNAFLQGEIGDLEQKIDTLIALYREQKVTEAKYQEQRSQVRAALDVAQENLERARDELRVQREVKRQLTNQSEDRLAALQEEIDILQLSVDELEDTTEELAGIEQKMAV